MDNGISAYVMRFTVAYTVALAILAVGTTLLGIKSGWPASGGALMAGVFIAVSRFVRDYERTPDQSERRRLAFGSLLASALVSVVLVVGIQGIVGGAKGILALGVLFSQIEIGIFLGALVLVSAGYASALWLAYGWLAKISYRTLARERGEI